MPSPYFHELKSYRVELGELAKRLEQISTPGSVDNLTHASFGLSNRSNFLLVGLCGLVEARLLELANEVQSSFKLSDIKGQGISRLQLYLGRSGEVKFGELRHWADFRKIYRIRNCIIHSYGGMIANENVQKARIDFAALEFDDALVGGRRIRITTVHLEKVICIVDGLLEQLGSYETEEMGNSL